MAKGAQEISLATPFASKTFFYSGPPLEAGPNSLGKRHYSYRFALRKFVDALTRAGASCVELPMPEFYADKNALPQTDRDAIARDVIVPHLIFRSTEEIRLLKFAYNIACFAWEFDVLDDFTRRDGNMLDNQAHMLSICDEVWVPCAFTKSVLNKFGVARVEVLPAPIDIPLLEADEATRQRSDWLLELAAIPALPMNHNPHWGLEDSLIANRSAYKPLFTWMQDRSANPLVFVSVFNPEDHRKNLNAMLRGFYTFSKINGDAVLIIKLVTSLASHDIAPREMVFKLIANKLDDNGVLQSDRILFVSDFLTDEELDALYRSADFYLCASIAEGQNLPLLEAMGRGAVPVSTRHTAMADYLDDENSIEVPSRRIDNFIPYLAPATFARRFQIDHSDEHDVFAALMAANSTPPEKRKRMSVAAAAAVRRLYGPELVAAQIAARLDAIARKIHDGVGA